MRLRSGARTAPPNKAELADFPEEMGAMLFGLVAESSWADIAACHLSARDGTSTAHHS